MKITVLLLSAFILLVAYVRLMESMVVFYPTRSVLTSPKDIGLGYEDVTFEAQDRVKLHGWLVKHPRAASTMIFFHGNAGNIGDRLGKIQLFYPFGVNIFIIDYRGYGLSQGRPTEKGIYLDAQAAYDYLRTRPDISSRPIWAYSESLGGVAAIDLATQRDLAALIVDSTFTSAADMAKRIMPVVPAFLLSLRFDNLSKIDRVKAPKLFIHSPEDEIVPYALGMKLYSAAPAPKAFLKLSGTHNEGFETSRHVFVAGIKDFLAKNNLSAE